MSSKSKVVVVIPIYNEVLKIHEIISLKQCFNVLKSHPIVFVCAKGLSTNSYTNLALECKADVRYELFDDVYFKNVDGYNKLMLSTSFYKRFEQYEYMLIHQTDVYVFRDELVMWCNSGYDYIGAPWLMDMKPWLDIPNAYPFIIKWFYKIRGSNTMQRTGNGGFSLRNIGSFIDNLDRYRFWVELWKSNEDNFFSQCLGLVNKFFKIPDYHLSVQFSFDALPQKAYKLNNCTLPFGCHAFNRNDGAYTGNAQFWSEFIPSLKGI